MQKKMKSCVAIPVKKSVKSDMGKPSEKKVALTRDIQKTFLLKLRTCISAYAP